jgi:DNA polymerase V
MQSLTDANGCFASMEKVYCPSIRFRPVVVLSSNDGYIIAVCSIAKRLGIPKFQPYFKIKSLLKRHNVVVRSSNYELYGDISDKMMSVIARFSDATYQYSIDEAFSRFTNFESLVSDWYKYGHEIRRAVFRETRMPVGVGFGETLTLAKAANFASKKLPDSDGVAVIDDEYSRKNTLRQMKLDDVWGVGPKLNQKLGLLGLTNAFDLACCSPKAMRQQFGVTVERTIEELNGVKCLSWDDITPPKKEIFSTRTFGHRITNANDLRVALTSHAIKVRNRALEQKSLIKKLYIFACNSPYDLKYIKKGFMYSFPIATDNVCSISSAVEAVVKSLYMPDVLYSRCGVGAVELESLDFQQRDFFKAADNPALMNCYNKINQKFGKGSLVLGTEARQESITKRSNYLSPRYTTRWEEVPIISC